MSRSRQGIRAARQTIGRDKPVYIGCITEGNLDRRFTVSSETIPTYPHPEIPARIINHALMHATWRQQPIGQAPSYSDANLKTAKALCAKALTERESGWHAPEETHAPLAAIKLRLVQSAWQPAQTKP